MASCVYNCNMSDATQRLQTLLGDGFYFPRELPPQFTTAGFAEKAEEIAEEWQGLVRPQHVRKLTWFQEELFSVPVVGSTARRRLAIVNPVPQMRVTNLIAQRWDEIQNHCRMAEYSAELPRIDEAVSGTELSEFSRQRSAIFGKHGRAVSISISRFSDSLYTHAIAWALHGKQQCKEWISSSKGRAELNEKLGGLLDQAIQAGQSGETVGIPDGPYTSQIILKIVNAAIDVKFERRSRLRAHHVSDWCIGIGQSETAGQVIADIAAACHVYGLDPTVEKIKVVGPDDFSEPAWLLEFGRDCNERAKSIQRFFAKAFQLANTHSRDALAHAVRETAKWKIQSKNDWDLLEGFLLTAARVETGIFSDVAKIFAARRKFVNRDRIRDLIRDTIADHAPLGHHYEVSWALSLAKEFSIKIPEEAVKFVCNMDSAVCASLLLDLRDEGCVDGQITTTTWRSCLNVKGLKTGMWMLTYEAANKGWFLAEEAGGEQGSISDGEEKDAGGRELVAAGKEFQKWNVSSVKDDGEFRILYDLGISFYNRKAKIAPDTDVSGHN